MTTGRADHGWRAELTALVAGGRDFALHVGDGADLVDSEVASLFEDRGRPCVRMREPHLLHAAAGDGSALASVIAGLRRPGRGSLLVLMGGAPDARGLGGRPPRTRRAPGARPARPPRRLAPRRRRGPRGAARAPPDADARRPCRGGRGPSLTGGPAGVDSPAGLRHHPVARRGRRRAMVEETGTADEEIDPRELAEIVEATQATARRVLLRFDRSPERSLEEKRAAFLAASRNARERAARLVRQEIVDAGIDLTAAGRHVETAVGMIETGMELGTTERDATPD